MNINKQTRRVLAAIMGCVILTTSSTATATVVEIQTVLGNFRVNLFDATTPITVNNFLDYVNNGAYSDSIVHRSRPGFVVQGGGFTFDGTLPLENVPQNAMISNEPELSNVRGTIAMAKISTGENTATNQWFINLADNSSQLDAQNGGFSVFGIVTDNGMAVVDAIAALPIFDFGQAFTTLPLQNYTTDDYDNGVELSANSLIIVNAIVVVDSTVDTGANLLPPANTTPAVTPTPQPVPNQGSSGGGHTGPLTLIGLLILGMLRRFRFANSQQDRLSL